MVAFPRRSPAETTLDARIAGLSRRAIPAANILEPATAAVSAPEPVLELANARAAAPAPVISASEVSEEDRLLLAREELLARLTAELSSERISILSRGELAKVVDAAVQAYFVRNGLELDPITRRDMITELIKGLLEPSKGGPVSDDSSGRRSSN